MCFFRRSFLLFAFALAASFASSAFAQDQDFETGQNPYRSYESGNIDSIDLLTRGLNVDIPLISYPQRGGKLALEFDLHYINQGNWWNYSGGGYTSSGPNLTNGFGVILKDFPSTWGASCESLGDSYGTYTCSASVTMSDGSSRSMLPITVKNWESEDTSGFQMDGYDWQGMSTPPVLIDANGTEYNQPFAPALFPYPVGGLAVTNYVPTLVEDTNGNEITYSSSAGWTDTMNRKIPLPVSANTSVCPQSPLVPTAAYTWSLPGVNGGSYNLTFCYVTVAVTVNWEGQIEHWNDEELQTVILPNGTKWTFQYTTDGNGDLSQITFPTGGTLSYTWTTEYPQCGAYSYGNARAVVTRTLNPNNGNPASVWTYGYESLGVTYVTDPTSNDAVHTFGELITNECPYYETRTQYYQGSHTSGTLLKTVNTLYQSLSSTTGITTNGQPSQTTTTWVASNQENESTFSYDSAITFHNPYWVSGTQFSTIYAGTWSWSYGLLETQNDYDYGKNKAGSLLRTTAKSYQALSNSNYLNNNLLNLPKTVQVSGSGPGSITDYYYDQTTPISSGITTMHSSSPPAGSYRGNLTTLSNWLNTTSGLLSTVTGFYDTGMPHTLTDPNLNITMTSYSSTYVGALPTTVTDAKSQSVSYTYDFNTGLKTSFIDVSNGNVTTSYAYNCLMRLSQVNYPDNGQTTYYYSDLPGTCTNPSPPAPPFYETVTRVMSTTSGSTPAITTLDYDGLGRVTQTQINTTPATNVQITYDTEGRKASMTNPYWTTSDATYGVTSFSYDALSRITLVTEPDGGEVKTTYCGSSTLVADEAGHWHRTTTDGLGRLEEADEPNSPTSEVTACPSTGDAIWATTYTHDVLDDLTGVVQGGSRNRSFVYDSLKRLTSATNPESGTVSYTYDNDGNSLTRKDARSITTTYTYDVLNRVTQKSYSDGTPTANYLYDVAGGFGNTFSNIVGRMTEAYTGSGNPLVSASVFGYDPLGRVLMNNQCDPSTCPTGSGYAMPYSYDLVGDIISSSASQSQVTFSYDYDTAARITSVTSNLVDANHPATLATVNSYLPSSQPSQMTYGNGTTYTTMQNPRLQPCRYNLNTSATVLKKCTDQIPSGNIQDLNFGFNYASGDNGYLYDAVATGTQALDRSYAYDQVNRVATMTGTGGTCTGLSWTYDEWGNRLTQEPTGGTCNMSTLTYSATNQLNSTGYTYDASGNLTNDSVHTYFYDAEDRIKQVDGTLGNCSTATACYSYDALGHRVEKMAGGVTTDYLYDLSGHVVTQFSSSCSMCWTVGYAYLDGALLAQYSNGTTYFVYEDHLDSSRVLTNMTEGTADCNSFYPYGEQDNSICSTSNVSTYKFTGIEWDAESNLYEFEARYYGSSLGRFMVPDPSGMQSFDLTTLNLYGYVEDSPLSLIDPSGLGPCPTNNSPTCTKSQQTPWGFPLLAGFATWDEFSSLENLLKVFPIYSKTITVGNPPIIFQDNLFEVVDFSVISTFGQQTSWWGTFWSTFGNGILHGIRSPGQSFGACIEKNISMTTGNQLDPSKVLSGGAAVAETVGTILATGKVTQANPMTGGTFDTTLATFAAQGLRVYGASRDVTLLAAVGANALADSLAVAGAATAGALAGSAINCR